MFFLIIMICLVTINALFLSVSNPLSMGLVIIAQTFCIAISTSMFLPSFWFSYILILVFLGGLLVLFIYVATLAANEKMNFSLPLFFLFPLFIFLMVSMSSTKNLKLSMQTDNFLSNSSFLWLSNSSLMVFALFLMVYLFIVLVAIVKIIKWWGGSLRPMK